MRMLSLLCSLATNLALYLSFGQTLAIDLTDGFTQLPLSDSNFEKQKPYDVPLNQRYSFVDGVHKMWVYSDDKAHSPNSNTKPRTEIRIRGYDYSSGVWQFEGQMLVPRGTSGVCIMQILGANGAATTTQLRIYDGSLKYYSQNTLVSGVYNRWYRINVIHNVGSQKVAVFVDGEQKLERKDRGGSNHYFKFGVYGQEGETHYMESRWKNIKIFKK